MADMAWHGMTCMAACGASAAWQLWKRSNGPETPTCLQRRFVSPHDFILLPQSIQEPHFQQRCAVAGSDAGSRRAHSRIGGVGQQQQVARAKLRGGHACAR